ncbi:cyclic GMP-AMP synthase-like [Diprion similis]|uniref:cyclic GMP-AMP synthase-like n=1 Tax=Diprion similis TaxID=362088 RepID=UPI001EF8EE02|nr:cyclic GMP-AMP synthase-like [Diprion similis]
MEKINYDKRFKSSCVFNQSNKQFVSLEKKQARQYNKHLQKVLNAFIRKAMEIDPLFNACYRQTDYVGSYYQGLKVGVPDEYDLNIILKLPISYEDLTILIASEKPGYIKIGTKSDILPNLQKHDRWPEYKRMLKWLDESNMCLDQNKFRQWFESLVVRTFQEFQPIDEDDYTSISVTKKYVLRHKKSGPALTLKIDVSHQYSIDVDLVPVLQFQTALPSPFRDHTYTKQRWLAIAKPLECPNDNILWRPSYYERERKILKRNGQLKPIIRQMKKFRDTQEFKSIASYHITTLFLWELEEQSYNQQLQRLPPTFLFYHMLKRFQEACEKREIRNFWYPKNNLLCNIAETKLSHINYKLIDIIKQIEEQIETNKYIIAEYVLNDDEVKRLKSLPSIGRVSR